MAERRMFAKTVIDSDAFLDMPLSAQALYFHLSMRADDDGFINNPKRIQKLVSCTDDDLKLLIAKHFIIPFESGIVVIKHWKIHNYIQKDRYKETVYQEEKAMLQVKENNAYTLTDTACIQNGYNLDTQVRLGKDRLELGKDRLVEDSVPVDTGVDNSTLEYMGGTLGKGVVLLTNAQSDALLEKLGLDAFNHYIDRLSSFIIEKNVTVGNHYKTILKWAEEDKRI